MAKFDLEDWKRRRQRCRVDLRYLCGVLGYRDVSKAVHGRIYQHCQQFQGGTEPLKIVRIKDGAGYTPAVSMWELPGKRKKLRLVTRGGLKTSIITQAEKIQWIINYPDIRIFQGSAQLSRAKDFLRGTKEQFTKNEIFRWLFPEFCPKANEQGKTEDFGNDEQFTVPCRRKPGIKEPTLRVLSADSSVAGGHYDVGDVDDGVEDQNTRTPGSIEQTKKFIASLWPLIETNPLPPGHGWFGLTGTIYSFSDAHFTIYSEEMKKPEHLREWDCLYIPANDDWPTCSAAMERLEQAEAKGIQDDIDRMREEVDKLDKEHSWWPQRIGIRHLRKIERDPALGPGVLFPQYLLKPLQDKDGLITSKDDIRWIPRKELDAYAARITWNVTVDLAGMETQTAGDTDYTVINLHGWGSDGRCYFDRIHWGRYSPDDVIERLFKLFSYRPQIQFIKIEKEAHARVLLPFLRKAMAKRGTYLPIMELQRDNRTSKVHRIRGTQPYWKNGAFVFAEDLSAEVRNQIELEALYFPKFNHDDILDTIADALQSRDGITSDVEGREKMMPTPAETDYREWRGIPVAAMSWEMLQGMTEEEYEGGLSAEFNPSASLFQ
jgi:predicted phage terminase large subunit-like protein